MNIVFFGLIINYTAIYMTAAAGASLSISAGDMNLGGECQIYAGGFITAIVLNLFSNSTVPFIPVFTATILAMIVSAGITMISALLKKYRGAEFLLTSFIVSCSICPLIDGLITGPFRNKEGSLLATPFIGKQFRLKSLIPPSSLNLYILGAICICIFFWYLMKKTVYGKQLYIFGKANKFAIYSGFSDIKFGFSSAAISGALHGLAGSMAVLGTYFTCHLGFSKGMGWNALAVSLIARANPLLLIPSALFFSILVNTADYLSFMNNFDFDISGIIQGTVLILITLTNPIIRDRSAK